jgi:hypothetical protein
MLAFWINYGSLLNIEGPAMYLVPLAMQGLPAVLLLKWPQTPLPRMGGQRGDCALGRELRGLLPTGLVWPASSSFWDLMKEMWLVPGNRKRAIISIFLMICQQMTGTNR